MLLFLFPFCAPPSPRLPWPHSSSSAHPERTRAGLGLFEVNVPRVTGPAAVYAALAGETTACPDFLHEN